MNHKDTIFMLVVFLVMGALAVLLFVAPQKEIKDAPVDTPYTDVKNQEYVSCGGQELVVPLKGEEMVEKISFLKQDFVMKLYNKDVENFGPVILLCFYSFKDGWVGGVSDIGVEELTGLMFEGVGSVELLSSEKKDNREESISRYQDESTFLIGRLIKVKNFDDSPSVFFLVVDQEEMLHYTEEEVLQVLQTPFSRSVSSHFYSASDIESKIVGSNGKFLCGDKTLSADFPVKKMLFEQEEVEFAYADHWFSLLRESSGAKGVEVSCYHFLNNQTESLSKDWYKSYLAQGSDVTNTESRKDGFIIVETFDNKNNSFSKTFYFIDNLGAKKAIFVSIFLSEDSVVPEWGKKMFESISIKNNFSQ